jgi:hypothetical protein
MIAVLDHIMYCEVFGQHVARQQFCKNATISEALSMSSAPRPMLVMDRLTRSLTSDMCFLCGLRQATAEQQRYAIHF